MAVDGATGEAGCAVEQVPVVETVTRDADGVVLERSTVAVSTRQAEERVASVARAARLATEAENRAAAARLRAVHAVWRECSDQVSDGHALEELFGITAPRHAVLDPWERAREALVVALGVHTHRAGALLGLATRMCERYPALLAAMEAGRLDEYTAGLLARQLERVDASVLPAVLQEYLDWYLGGLDEGRRPGRHAQLRMVDRIVAAHDPEGLRRRREFARRTRGVHVRPRGDGLCGLSAVLDTAEAALVAARLDHDAGAGTPGSRDARRADALVALATAPAHPADGRAGRVVLRPRVSVVVPPGRDDEPRVHFERTGEAALCSLTAMITGSDGASVERVVTPVGVVDEPLTSLGYRVPAALARRVRLRDGTCRHPGCSVPARHCDIDHVIPFDHADPARGGRTVESNLMCLCRGHHRFKTFARWCYRLAADGTLTVTTGGGAVLGTTPAGPLAEARETRWARRAARIHRLRASPPGERFPRHDEEPPPF